MLKLFIWLSFTFFCSLSSVALYIFWCDWTTQILFTFLFRFCLFKNRQNLSPEHKRNKPIWGVTPSLKNRMFASCIFKPFDKSDESRMWKEILLFTMSFSVHTDIDTEREKNFIWIAVNQKKCINKWQIGDK